MPDPDKLIFSPELASYWAHAEKPYRDIAKKAADLGALSVEAMQSLEQSLDKQAHDAGLEAVTQHIARLTENLSVYTHSEVVEPETAFTVDKEGLMLFAETTGRKKKFASQIFNALSREAYRNPAFAATEINDDPESPLETTGLNFTRSLGEMTNEILDVRFIGSAGVQMLTEYLESRVALAE